MSAQEATKAIDRAFDFAATGAGASLLVKFCNPLPISDVLSQAVTMKVISDDIAKIYDLKTLPGRTSFMGKLLGIGGGVKLSSEVIMLLPLIGIGASTMAAFSIQMTASVVFILIFELRQQGLIPEDYMKTASPGDIAYLLRLAVEVLGDLVLGKERFEAVSKATEKFQQRSAGAATLPDSKSALPAAEPTG